MKDGLTRQNVAYQRMLFWHRLALMCWPHEGHWLRRFDPILNLVMGFAFRREYRAGADYIAAYRRDLDKEQAAESA